MNIIRLIFSLLITYTASLFVSGFVYFYLFAAVVFVGYYHTYGINRDIIFIFVCIVVNLLMIIYFAYSIYFKKIYRLPYCFAIVAGSLSSYHILFHVLSRF